MSCVLTLTSAAIIAGVTLSGSSSLAVLTALRSKEKKEQLMDEGLETVFMDAEILLSTLKNEYDCHVNQISENEYDVITVCGVLKYKRTQETEAFRLYLREINDPDGLLENIRSFEVDYGRNVQAYTYGHIKETLSSDMELIEEEILEDDTILLTIRVD